MPAERPSENDIQSLRGWLRLYGWAGFRGPVQRSVRDAIRRRFRGSMTGFTLEEIMDECGLDYEKWRDRTASHGVIDRMRAVTVEFSEWFARHPRYGRFVNDGLSGNAVFRKLVKAMASYEIFPLYYERDSKNYKPLTLKAWARLTYLRGIAIRNEFVERTEDIVLMERKFPELRDLYPPPSLPTDDHFIALPGPRRFPCELCGLAFTDDASVHDHKRRRHPGEMPAPDDSDEQPPDCPDCGGSLGQMERGDWVCRECKTIFDRDKIASIAPTVGRREQ